MRLGGRVGRAPRDWRLPKRPPRLALWVAEQVKSARTVMREAPGQPRTLQTGAVHPPRDKYRYGRLRDGLRAQDRYQTPRASLIPGEMSPRRSLRKLFT